MTPAISFRSAGTVGILKDLIKEKKRPEFDVIAPHRLHLWQVDNMPVDGALQGRINSLWAVLDHKEPLSPVARMLDIFDTDTKRPLHTHLHIIVQVPPSTLADVRKEYVKQFIDTPSIAGRPGIFVDLQGKSTEQIFCSRPRGVVDPIPVTLLEPIFAQFVDDGQDQNYDLTDDDHAFSAELSHEMCKFHPSERMRLHEFRNILYTYGITLYTGLVGSSQAATHGHLIDRTHVKVILEGRNEIGSYGAEPFVEAMLYYRKFLQFVDPNKFEEHKALFPCFHLICTGACIGILSTVFSTKVQSDILVPIIPLFWHSTDLPMETVAVRTLAAFRVAVKKLEALPTTTPEPVGADGTIIYPYPRDYVDSAGILQEFTYDKDQPSRQRLVFFGTNNGGARICIKFARMYSDHAHRFCASKGHAPNLIAYKPLPGSWKMIVMDFIDISSYPGPYCTGLYRRFSLHIPRILSMQESITTLIKELHTEGYVHGDVRDTNIFVQVQEDHEGTAIPNFMLFDFDWAGPVGETRYPLGVNRRGIYRPENARGGSKVLPEDDLDMLRCLFPLERKRESTPDEEAAPTSRNT